MNRALASMAVPDSHYDCYDEHLIPQWKGPPHPLAYVYIVSKEVDFLKNIMKGYCRTIQQVRQETHVLREELFGSNANSNSTKSKSKMGPSKSKSRHPKTMASMLHRLEYCEQKETEYRNGFLLAKSLWQLQRCLVKTYLTQVRFINDPLSERERERLIEVYQTCGLEQASISKEINDWFAPDQIQYCDDSIIRYTLQYYCQCEGCVLFFHKKDLPLFGRCSDAPWSSFNFNPKKDTTMSELYFHCTDCYTNHLEPSEEDETPTNPLCHKSSNRNHSSHVSTGSSSTNTHTEDKPTLRTKRRKKKKKKKKKKQSTHCVPEMEQRQTLEASSLKTLQDQEEEEYQDHKDMASMLHHQQHLESCPDTSIMTATTWCSSSSSMSSSSFCGCTGDGSEGNLACTDADPGTGSIVHVHANEHDEKEEEDDPNQLWVDYLCKTGSMIALDRYMDEMDPVLGGEDYYLLSS